MVAPRQERCDRLLEGAGGVVVPSHLARGLAEPSEDDGPLLMAGRRQGQGSFEARHCCGDVKVHRLVAGQQEVPDGVRLEAMWRAAREGLGSWA